MKNQIVKISIDNPAKEYKSTMEQLYEVRDEFSSLEIKGVDDKEGYSKVKKAISFSTKILTTLESIRKQMKSQVLVVGREIDKEANDRKEIANDIRDPLKAKLKVIDDIVKEKQLKKAKELQEKLDAEQAEIDRIDAEHQEQVTAYWSYENARLDAIKAEQKATQNKLDAQQVEIDAKIEKNKAEKFDIHCESLVNSYLGYYNAKVESDKENARLQKIKDDEKAETERINAENETAKIKLDREKYLDSIKPDIQKIKEFAESLSFLSYPQLNDEKTAGFMNGYRKKLDTIRVEILEKMEQYK